MKLLLKDYIGILEKILGLAIALAGAHASAESCELQLEAAALLLTFLPFVKDTISWSFKGRHHCHQKYVGIWESLL